MQYRPDIDGLRAIAVVPAVLFHAGTPYSGGFIGVDVFFVIFCYLITSIIVSELDANTFSLASFYQRRVRKNFPGAHRGACILRPIGGIVYPRLL